MIHTNNTRWSIVYLWLSLNLKRIWYVWKGLKRTLCCNPEQFCLSLSWGMSGKSSWEDVTCSSFQPLCAGHSQLARSAGGGVRWRRRANSRHHWLRVQRSMVPLVLDWRAKQREENGWRTGLGTRWDQSTPALSFNVRSWLVCQVPKGTKSAPSPAKCFSYKQDQQKEFCFFKEVSK